MSTKRVADQTDRAILRELIADPDATLVAVSERTGLARNTVRARLARLKDEGSLRSFESRITPAFLGYPLRAHILVTVTQRRLDQVGAELATIDEVLEVQGLSGVSDLIVQVAGQDADDLYRVAGRILAITGVERTVTGLVMREMVPYRVDQLL